MIVAELMTQNPQTVGPSDSLEVAHEKMQVGWFRQVPVVHEGKLVGILTDRDMRQHVGQLTHTRVDAVMSGHPFSVQASTPIEEAAHLLVINKVGSLPVIENGKLVGIIPPPTCFRPWRQSSEVLQMAASESISMRLVAVRWAPQSA